MYRIHKNKTVSIFLIYIVEKEAIILSEFITKYSENEGIKILLLYFVYIYLNIVVSFSL